MAIANAVAHNKAGTKKVIRKKKLNFKKALRRTTAVLSIAVALATFAKVDAWANKTHAKFAVPDKYISEKNVINESIQASNSFTPYVIWQGYKPEKINKLQEEMGTNINEIIFANAGINGDGQLELHDGPPKESELLEMKKQGKTLTLMVTDFEIKATKDKKSSEEAVKKIFESEEEIKKLANHIANRVKELGYDKVNIDFEKLQNYSTKGFYLFAEELNSQLKKTNRTISFSVYPKRYAAENKILDYNRLAELGDVCIMLYNEHYTGSKPGAVASSKFKEDVIRFTYDNVEAKNLGNVKVIDANYALVWGIPIEKNGKIIMANGHTVTNEIAAKLAQKYGGTVKWDEQKGTNYAAFNYKGKPAFIYFADSKAAGKTQEIITKVAIEKGKPALATGLWDGGSLFADSNLDKEFVKAKRDTSKESIALYAKQLEAIKIAEEEFREKYKPENIGQKIQAALAEEYLGAQKKVLGATVEPVKKKFKETKEDIKNSIDEKISGFGF